MLSMKEFGELIATKRKELGYTQETFAKKLGITPQAVSKWENGIGYPDITLFPAIADVFDMTTDELFGREVTVREEPEPEEEILQDDVFEDAETADECEYCEAEEVNDSENRKAENSNDKITIDLSFIKSLGKDIANGLKGFKSDVEASIKNAGINRGNTAQEAQTSDRVDCVLESFNSIYARLCNSCEAKIIKSDRFEIKAWGSKKFIDSLSFGVTNGKLNVVMKNYASVNERNHIEIYVNFDKGEMIDVNTSGAVDLDIEPDFGIASFVTSGACDVNAKNFGQVVSKLSGACSRLGDL